MLYNNDLISWPTALEQQYRALNYWQDKTLFDYLTDTVRSSPQATAVICGNRRLSYEQLSQRSAKLAQGFSALGLSKGDNVVLQMTNVAEFYECFFALLQKGIRPVLALPAHRAAEIQYFCQHTNAKAYIIDGDTEAYNFQQLALDVLDACPTIEHVVVKGEANHHPQFVSLSACYEQTVATQNADADADDIAFFQLSGGTTGTPKLIPRTHNDYAYSITASVEICEFDQSTCYLCALPAAHNFPLSSPGALGVFWAGGTVVLTQDPAPQNAFGLIARHKVTVSALVPPLALLWMGYAEHSPLDISSLSLVQVGGAKFSEAAARRLPKALNCKLQQVFGMAEGLVNYTRLDDSDDVIFTTQGRPISPLDELVVVDEQGQPVTAGEEGVLLTQGPYTIRGYYKAPEHNNCSFNAQGFYRTGDIVKITAAGNIIVTGRDKDQINRGGEKIAAEEVENQILLFNGVHDAALIAIPDDYLGERSCAVVVNKPDISIKPLEIKRFLRSRGMADYKIPDKVVFVERLPKTSVGKVNKKALREQFS